jgi:hypothetical protein
MVWQEPEEQRIAGWLFKQLWECLCTGAAGSSAQRSGVCSGNEWTALPSKGGVCMYVWGEMRGVLVPSRS